MRRGWAFVLVMCFCAWIEVPAQIHIPQPRDGAWFCSRKSENLDVMRPGYVSQSRVTEFDVTFYSLDLRVSVAPSYLHGQVTVRGKALQQGLTMVTLDLAAPLRLDSVSTAATRLQFIRHPAAVTILLNRSYGHGESVVLDLFYQGLPVSTGFGSFEFGSNGTTPWVWTLSEPYGARDWWPCVDHPLDKADSVDVRVTCRRDLKVASNGKLHAVVPNADSTYTYEWRHRYPIASYLVFVSLTNYSEFTNWFRYSPTDSMPVLNYVLPEHLADALDSLPRVIPMLQIFSEKFGLYPFINEKYGHAQFNRGGAMEHQTMTSLVRYAYDERALAHELAHQWFGNLVTCASWPHLWLNEGFASYAEAIYGEARYGMQRYKERILDDIRIARTGVGPVVKSDTTVVRQLFDQGTVYRKGSAILHMLRRVVGDSLFFRSLREFLHEPGLRFGVATTEDFRRICERVSGRSLSWFFSQWLYGENYPRYAAAWSAVPFGAQFMVTFTLSQSTGTANPPFFQMPVPIRLSAAGWDTTIVVWNDLNPQTLQLLLPSRPTALQIDPDDWILKSIESASGVEDTEQFSLRLEQNYPNPFNPTTTIRFAVGGKGLQRVTLTVYDIVGRLVATLVNDVLPAGEHEAILRGDAIASGVYFYRLQAGDRTLTRHMVVVK